VKVKNFLLFWLSLSCLVGCASPRYSAYIGSQVWFTAKDSIADHGYAMPVYWNWTERHYRVMGSIELANPKGKWKNGDTIASARLGSSKEGDAIIVLAGDETDTVQNAIPALRGFPARANRALVIQWKSQSEVDEESHRLDGLRAYLKRSYPALGLGNKHDLWEMSVEYVTWLGLDLNAQPGAAKVEEVLSSLVATSAETSKRLFKGTLRAQAPSARSRESVVYGIATVTRTGDDVNIVSQTENMTLNFQGVARDGQCRGQVDFSLGPTVLTGKAEGSVSTGKILLRTEGPANGKTIEGAFIFLQ
jgi:hypothetical protein